MSGSELQTNQIMELHRQGYTAEQIALGLDLLPGAVDIIIRGQRSQVEGNEARFGQLKDLALEALEHVLKYDVDSPSARVTAAKVVLDEVEKGQKVFFDYQKLADLISNGSKRVIECESRVIKEREEGNTSECRELELV